MPAARESSASETAAPIGRPRAGRFAGDRILIVGCGDVGVRLVRYLDGRFRVAVTTRSPAHATALRALGVAPLVVDLDRPHTLCRLAGLAATVVHLAPPPSHGTTDPRTRALVASLAGVERFVYVSTSGVYGDCAGAWIDETRAPAPSTDRARRRVDAERTLRSWARTRGVRLSILRVPGIYAGDRLPTARIADGTPAIESAEDGYTNHVHADDLARIVAIAIRRGAPQRVYHAVDDSAIKMGDWFDLVADAHGMPRPRRVARAALADAVSETLSSFMRESRRLSNVRMKRELGVTLAFPTVREGLDTTKKKAR